MTRSEYIDSVVDEYYSKESYLRRFLGKAETFINVPTGERKDDGKVKTYPGSTAKYKLVYDPELDENL